MGTEPKRTDGNDLKRDTAERLRETASTLEELEVTLHEIASRGATKRAGQLEDQAKRASAKAKAALRAADRLDAD